MTVYLDVVILLNFLVDWLLLMGANRLCGHPPNPGRTALSGLAGGLYGGVCLLPGFAFLGNFLWRTATLFLMAGIAFGFRPASLRRGIVFFFLCMAVGGIASGTRGGFWDITGVAAAVCGLCVFGFRSRIGVNSYIPVELTYGGKRLCLTALRDTGNTLCDPVTGGPVLVVDSDAARELTGLTQRQLRMPVETMGAMPGLRLVPYRAVGTQEGLLLALQVKNVKIGSWQGSHVVALAPGKLSSTGEYQALTGGTV